MAIFKPIIVDDAFKRDAFISAMGAMGLALMFKYATLPAIEGFLYKTCHTQTFGIPSANPQAMAPDQIPVLMARYRACLQKGPRLL